MDMMIVQIRALLTLSAINLTGVCIKFQNRVIHFNIRNTITN